MKAFLAHLIKHKVAYIVSAVIAVAIGAAIFLTFFFVQEMELIGAVNGVSVAFIALIAAGAFIWLGKAGAFDTMSYGFKQMFSSFFSKEANKYNDFVEYKNEKNAIRESSAKIHFVFFIIAFFFGVAIIVLEIIFHTLY